MVVVELHSVVIVLMSVEFHIEKIYKKYMYLIYICDADQITTSAATRVR
jgi:hypothetical protein